ncbi:hypothetical protein ACHAQJ_005848 [Trichoderma viride]
MEMNNTFRGNTISEFLGDEDKENDPQAEVVPPRPRRRNCRQGSAASIGYKLGPRIKVAKKDLDFAIYNDETAHKVLPPRREYYGSNLPALPEVKNGVKFEYALHHVLRRNFEPLMDQAFAKGDRGMMDTLVANYMNYDVVPMRERVTGLYQWSAGAASSDVWLWVQDKGYHRRWTGAQMESFQDFLEWMKMVVDATAGRAHDNQLMMALDDNNTRAIMEMFGELGLPNLKVEKANLVHVYFIPTGVDKHVIYRRDFLKEEQDFIDLHWPGYWAPGEEREVVEEVEEMMAGE